MFSTFVNDLLPARSKTVGPLPLCGTHPSPLSEVLGSASVLMLFFACSFAREAQSAVFLRNCASVQRNLLADIRLPDFILFAPFFSLFPMSLFWTFRFAGSLSPFLCFFDGPLSFPLSIWINGSKSLQEVLLLTE